VRNSTQDSNLTRCGWSGGYSDYWGVYFEKLEAIKEALDASQISIPYPQRDLHIYNHEVPKNL
jgi:small conductance mechanosensitive channel